MAYQPVPFRPKNKLVRIYTLPFQDRVGNKADITYADFYDKHNNLVEGHILYVKWRS